MTRGVNAAVERSVERARAAREPGSRRVAGWPVDSVERAGKVAGPVASMPHRLHWSLKTGGQHGGLVNRLTFPRTVDRKQDRGSKLIGIQAVAQRAETVCVFLKQQVRARRVAERTSYVAQNQIAAAGELVDSFEWLDKFKQRAGIDSVLFRNARSA